MSETEGKDFQPKTERTTDIEDTIAGYWQKYADPNAKPSPGASASELAVYMELKRQRSNDEAAIHAIMRDYPDLEEEFVRAAYHSRTMPLTSDSDIEQIIEDHKARRRS